MSSSQDDFLAEAIGLVAAILQADPAGVGADDGARTLPTWDSLKTILLASHIEVERGITLESAEIEQLTSVRAVAAVIARHAGR